MAQTQPQQGGANTPAQQPSQQQGGSTGSAPQAGSQQQGGKPVFKDWASI